MKKMILIIIIYVCVTSSCGSIPKSIRNAVAFCYTNTYTGIDTLINIEGYYSNMIFYDNGLVVRPIYRLGEQLLRKDFMLIEEVAKNPKSKTSKNFYNFVDCGNYIICGDTIKIQMLHNHHSMNDDWDGWGEWYKIVDKNTLCFIDRFLLTTNKKEQDRFRKYYNSSFQGNEKILFVPISTKPPLEYFWILKEKWFWCNEQEWENHMKYVEY